MTEQRRFRWLHLSDLHVGMALQDSLWSNVRAAFFEDLEAQIKKTGPVDLVIFSGDLTQQAGKKEYERLNLILNEIWQQLERVGSSAPLLPVPGNHDVFRPKKDTATSILLTRWWEEPAAKGTFWRDGSDLRRFVEKAFRPYCDWLASSEHVKGLGNYNLGVLPGDISITLKVGPLTVGLVGLNSSWLQLAAGDYEKRLDVDIRQLLAVTNNDPPSWREQHDLALLITHHPVSWLHPESHENWASEINPPGRFDAHLFGHMHVSDSQSISDAGSERRTALQAPSIFGLEYFGTEKLTRIHGYSIGEIELTSAGKVRKVWPRILHRHRSGKRRFIPDFSFELDEENCFTETYSSASGSQSPQPEKGEKQPIELSPVGTEDADQLDAIRYQLSAAPAHERVRLPEQEACISALREKRLAWLQAEWGLGSDGFIWSVLKRAMSNSAPIYRFDFSEYEGRDKFLDSTKRTTGFTFEKLCALIAKQQTAHIIFDNVDPLSTPSGSQFLEEVQGIASVVLDYCPECTVFIRSRAAPPDGSAPIRLRPLDEADTATYILYAPLGGKHLSRADSASKLHRVTDGAPSRLDGALKNLQVVGLDDLIAQDADYASSGTDPNGTPQTLVRTINELRDSDDPFIRRSFELLKTLTVFPQGEQLDPVRRFDNAFPFFPPHAAHLLDRGLIDANPISEVAPSEPGLEIRVLTVARSIRDFLRGEMTPAYIQRMDERAFEVYFGRNWRTGDFTSPVGHKFDEPLQHGYKIANANALILRLMVRASYEQDKDSINTAFRITAAYFAALIRGNHYRSVVALAGDLSGYLEDEDHAREATIIKSQYARSLRMIGEPEKARDIYEQIDKSLLSKDAKRSALLNLALCYDKLDDPRSKDVSEEVIKLGKTEPAALHAQAIIIEATEIGESRFSKLQELMDEAKRRKYPMVVNTIALTMSDIDDVADNKIEPLLDGVLLRARDSKDFYNGVRAIVKICNIKTNRKELLTDRQRNTLIEAYHFLFNERLTVLFDNCHSALWSEFERGADIENLLRLFRHSSLIWRLRNSGDREQKYMKQLSKKVKPNSNVAAMLPRETAYFLARAGVVLNLGSSLSSQRRISKAKAGQQR